MALLTPLYMEAAPGDPAIPYSAALDRAGLLGAVFSREGVLDKDANHLRVTQRAEGANFSVDVAPGRCAIFGDDISDQGTYVCISTTPVNLSLPAKPASGSRTHRVVARIRDKSANGVWTGYDWVIELLADTGSGTPAQPNSAITLATVTVSSSALSVTNANISDQRLRSTVGTPALNGNWIESGIHVAYGDRDATRPMTWSKTPDGWVQLSGWFRRSGGTGNAAKDATYPFDGSGLGPGVNPVLPPEARPTGTRDVIGITANGYVHYAIYASGTISYRFNYATSVAQNLTWFSFEGVTFRAVAF